MDKGDKQPERPELRYRGMPERSVSTPDGVGRTNQQPPEKPEEPSTETDQPPIQVDEPAVEAVQTENPDAELVFDDLYVKNQETRADRNRQRIEKAREVLDEAWNHPKVDKYKVRKQHLTKKNISFATAGVLIVIIAVSSSAFISPDQFTLGDQDAAVSSLPEDYTGATAEDAGFETVGSNNAPSEDKRAFDPVRDIVTYQDTLGGQQITVTQQQLPENIADGTITVKDLASSLLNKSNIDQYNSEKGPIYISTEVDESGQSLIVGFDPLLIFITSDSVIDPALWINYVNRLE